MKLPANIKMTEVKRLTTTITGADGRIVDRWVHEIVYRVELVEPEPPDGTERTPC